MTSWVLLGPGFAAGGFPVRGLRAYVARNGRGGEPRRGREPAMARRPRPLISILTAGAAIALAAAGLQSGGAAQAKPPAKPTKVVDHPRRRAEQGDRRQVRHGQRAGADGRLRRHPEGLPRAHRVGDGRDPQRAHLGPAAQAHGLDDEGYRDVEDVLPNDTTTKGPNVGEELYITSNFGRARSSRCRTTTATRSWPTTSTTPARSTRSARRPTPPTGSAVAGRPRSSPSAA